MCICEGERERERLTKLHAPPNTTRQDAQYNLALLLAYGAGVEKNETEAVFWYTKAAEQDTPDAMMNLGNMVGEHH